jgi:hypothetical protein
MSELHVVKRGLVSSLRDSVEKNLERYVAGDFSDILTPEYVIGIKDTYVDLNQLQKLDPRSGGKNDVTNAKIVYGAIKGLSRYVARDERLWVWFTHGPCLGYARNRWIDQGNTDDMVKQIKAHFFASGERGFERNNAIACLWWWAEIASQYDEEPLDKVLEVFLHQTDVRASIIERPTITQPAFKSIMKVLIEKYDSDPTRNFFKRSNNKGVYKKWLVEINRYAGVRMYEAFTESENTELFRKLAEVASNSDVESAIGLED